MLSWVTRQIYNLFQDLWNGLIIQEGGLGVQSLFDFHGCVDSYIAGYAFYLSCFLFFFLLTFSFKKHEKAYFGQRLAFAAQHPHAGRDIQQSPVLGLGLGQNNKIT